MDFHHRKMLKIRKIEEKKHVKCPDECKDISEKQKLCPKGCKNESDDMKHSSFPPPPSATYQFSPILIAVLCILGAGALFVIAYLWINRNRSGVRIQRRRNPQLLIEHREDLLDENQGPVVDHPIWYIRTVGLQESVIDSIEVFRYRKGESLIEGTDCSVCLSEFQEDENLRLLPKCTHAFHIQCIDTWLRTHKNCPLCRAPIVNDANDARVNAVHQNLHDLASGQENRVENTENDAVGENRTSETRPPGEGTVSSPTEEENNVEAFLQENSFDGSARKNKGRGKSDLGDHSVKVHQELEVVRRSFSIGSRSASNVYYTMVNNCRVGDAESSNVDLAQRMKQNSEIVSRSGSRNSSIYSLMKTSSLGRSLQKVPMSMKRSLSSAGKTPLPTHDRSQNL